MTAKRTPTPPITPRCIDDLPSPDTLRWTPRRKAAVLEGVRSGILSLSGACLRYGVSEEELESWDRAMKRHGIVGLRVTKLQEYRA